MSKNGINLNALKPIMNILDMRMRQELAGVNAKDLMANLKEVEKSNEDLIKTDEYKQAVKEANAAIAKLNKVIGNVNKKIGGDAYSFQNTIDKDPWCRLSTKVVTGKNKYDYEHMKITERQYLGVAQTLEDQRNAIEMKYENIKAQIMLAGDYAQIRDILAGYSIPIDAPMASDIDGNE